MVEAPLRAIRNSRALSLEVIFFFVVVEVEEGVDLREEMEGTAERTERMARERSGLEGFL